MRDTYRYTSVNLAILRELPKAEKVKQAWVEHTSEIINFSVPILFLATEQPCKMLLCTHTHLGATVKHQWKIKPDTLHIILTGVEFDTL